MLFFPGAISSFFATVLFFVVVVGGGLATVKIYYQKAKITSLEKKIVQYQDAVAAIDDKEKYFKKSIEVLQRSCNRTVKPAVTGGKLNVENLFNNEPR
jgi:predicted negative regulator of RcsB-dependent stress response